ncbi:isochorismate synthase [Pseudokineococcus sp. 1T1Z-3]|uniref:isochorismate synthase n=1 Tax=Pseudokineococcus sp. 1T1Z-3 TaxID=3132745 RepID=UPI00309930E2
MSRGTGTTRERRPGAAVGQPREPDDGPAATSSPQADPRASRPRTGLPAPPGVGPTASPADLLAALRLGEDTLWSSPAGTLLARGVAERVELPWTDELPGAVADRLRAVVEVGGAPASEVLVVGALPFAVGGAAALVRPHSVRRGAGRLPRAGAGPVAGTTVQAETAVPPEPAYEDAVRRALGLLADGTLEKVVLARALDVTTDAPVDVGALVATLARHDEEARVFAVPLPPEEGRGLRTLVGASPELLVALRGGQVLATPLAGSTTRSPDPEEDAARARALLASEKDRREHALVVEAMARSFAPWCAELDVPAEPELVATPTLWHLATRLRGRTADPATTSLHLAQSLHPTPAVGGTPDGAARAAIADLETVDRGFYAGAVGWQDATGDGEWAVTIRCGVVEGSSVRLHAGAGIVAGSDPDAELAETSAKLALLRSALGA